MDYLEGRTEVTRGAECQKYRKLGTVVPAESNCFVLGGKVLCLCCWELKRGLEVYEKSPEYTAEVPVVQKAGKCA